MPLTREQKVELLGATPLFAGVELDQLAGIADRAVELETPRDGVILRQGEIGTGFFIIVAGRVRVVRDAERIADLGPGEFFGELSVLDRLPRNAQVAAEEPTTCLALASWDLEAVLTEDPRIALAMLRAMAARLRTTTDAHRH
jgi:CRP/FNR family transcriptional regulator, cyclic AMP receptor protein